MISMRTRKDMDRCSCNGFKLSNHISNQDVEVPFFSNLCLESQRLEQVEAGMAKDSGFNAGPGTTSRDAQRDHSSTAERARGTECHWFCSSGGGTNGWVW